MTSPTTMNKSMLSRHGFTLLELIVVMVIIATMLTVAMPYATRSGKYLKLKQAALNIATAAYYARDLAASTGTPTRMTVDPKENSYSLGRAIGPNMDYEPIEGFLGLPRYLDKVIRITDITDFDIDAGKDCLIFDPARPWPTASLSLATEDTVKTITITGLRIEVTEAEIED